MKRERTGLKIAGNALISAWLSPSILPAAAERRRDRITMTNDQGPRTSSSSPVRVAAIVHRIAGAAWGVSLRRASGCCGVSCIRHRGWCGASCIRRPGSPATSWIRHRGRQTHQGTGRIGNSWANHIHSSRLARALRYILPARWAGGRMPSRPQRGPRT